MGHLGTPERVIYESKFFRTGLNDLQAYVLKPDNSELGPYNFTEMPSPMRGRYYFDLMTMLTDPEGDYSVAIFSPTEDYQTTQRLSIFKAPVDLSHDLSVLEAQIAALNLLITSLLSSVVPQQIYANITTEAKMKFEIKTSGNITAIILPGTTIRASISTEENI